MRAAWILLVLALSWQGFAQTGMNYAAPLGNCELDENGDGLADGWLRWHRQVNNPNWADLGIFFTLSPTIKVEGSRSQEIRISRSQGTQGSFVVELRPIWETRLPYFVPPVGTPLLVRGWIRTEGLQNVSIQVRLLTGQREMNLANISSDTQGWLPLSLIVPLEATTQGTPRLYCTVEIFHGAGAASGRIWIDSMEALWTGFSLSPRTRSNSLKIAHYNIPVSHWQMLLDPAVDFLIAPLSHAHAISQYLPSAQVGVYVNAAQTADTLPVSWSDMYGGYHFVLQERPHWLLRRNGQPFNNPGYPYLWGVDIGLQEVREQFVRRFMQAREQVHLPQWIFLDDTGAHWQCDQYPNLDGNQQAWTGFFAYVIPEIHQRTNRTHKFMMNSGSWAGRFVDGNEGEQWIQLFDGVMLEHCFVFYRRQNGGEYVPQTYRHNRRTLHKTDSTWWGTLRAVTSYPNKVWVLVPMCDAEENPAMFRYILASYFVVAHSNTYLMVEDRRTAGGGTYHKWLRRPEPWVPLGNPTGSWYILAGTTADHTGALFARNFEHGIVLVNPTDPNPNDPSQNRVYEYTLPRAYKNWDGQVVPAGTRIQIGPKTGLVFYAAPEIRISISPQQITALPGETVTFTVQYRNDGLADGTNIRISVPLPEGLEFVSSSTGGQLLNRQITWTLPQVRAGQSGTLTFQARVQ